MLKLYNTLTKKVDEFIPMDPTMVTIYACGPTVYDYAHLGNFRTYTMTDFLVRTLRYQGYRVKFVMNITDVGHLVSDADSGEDKMEKGAKREGKTAWHIAQFYTDAFLRDSQKLHLIEPDVRPKPTEHIPEQIEMVRVLLQNGYAYAIDDGIYFDTSKCKGYGVLTGQNPEELKAGARVEVNPQKRNSTDFALWKLSPNPFTGGPKRQMEWESPWGMGFPGWHIECSAMSRKHLGDQMDIHTGGADLIPVHHTNEIAQSEAATGKKPFVRYWVHGQFILVDGEKMAKSKGNFYRLEDIEGKGFRPLALRYLYLTAHYRSFLNFTWEGLTHAANAIAELRDHVSAIKKHAAEAKRTELSPEKMKKIDAFRLGFSDAIGSDLNAPQALAVLWEVIKSNVPAQDKLDLILSFDEVLGLTLSEVQAAKEESAEIPPEILELVKERDELRFQKRFDEGDVVRRKIEALSYTVSDSSGGVSYVKKKPS